VWGKEFPDTTYTSIEGTPIRDIVIDENYFDNEFLESVSQRSKARSKTAGASTATAICNHVHDWWYGCSSPNQVVSMGVIPEESHYGISNQICFSYPVTIQKDGEWKIVDGL